MELENGKKDDQRRKRTKNVNNSKANFLSTLFVNSRKRFLSTLEVAVDSNAFNLGKIIFY